MANKKKNNDQQQELSLLLMSIKAIRARVNDELDALEMKIANLLPPERPKQKIKDWSKFLDS
jgi:hypothetical protein